jgi:hypothetical protein
MGDTAEHVRDQLHIVREGDQQHETGLVSKFLTPVNDYCLDCNNVVAKFERQEIAFDDRGECRRRCGACIIKENQRRVQITLNAAGLYREK